MIKARNILAFLTAGLIVGSGQAHHMSMVSPGSAVDAVAGAVEDVASSLTGSHLGFDTGVYPGDDTMESWRQTAPYKWVGYYLPAPCHKDDSWSGKRAHLTGSGWGLAVIYVGQQTWDGIPAKHSTVYRTKYVNKTVTKYRTKRVKRYVKTKSGKRVARYVKKRVPRKVKARVPVRQAVRVAFDESQHELMSCQRNLVTPSRGVMEADDAIAKTASEGFPRGTVIFLDVERMESTPKAMREYYKAWTARVLADGRFTPGVYAHVHNAPLIYRDVKSVYDAAGRSDEPPFWVAGGRNFSPTKAPHEVGHAFAAVWQGILDVVQEWNGHKVKIDVNVAQTPSPSLHSAESD